MPRAVAYLRCSTDKQPLSLAQQRAAIESWAAEQNVMIARWYTDDAISGASAENRGGFQAMVSDVERYGDVSRVLCYDVSRFGRTDNDEAGFYRFRLRAAGAEVVYVAEAGVTGAPTDELLLPVLQYQKREALRSLSRDTVRGLCDRAQRGAWCGGPAPFGYARELRAADGTSVRVLGAGERARTDEGGSVWLVPGDPAEVAAVRLAWDMRYLGGAGWGTIRDGIAALGVSPRRTHAWRTTSIRALCQNAVYTGRMTYGTRTQAKFHRASRGGAVARTRGAAGRLDLHSGDPIVVEGAHEPLCSDAAAAAFRAQETGERRRPRTRHRRVRKSPWLLSGMVTCARCGSAYVGVRSTRRKAGRAYVYESYVCNGYVQSGTKRCVRRPLGREEVEDAVLGHIRDAWLDVAMLDRVRDRLLRDAREIVERSRADAEEAGEKIAAIDARMGAIVLAIDPAHADVANAALTDLKAERETLEARAEAARRALVRVDLEAEVERAMQVAQDFDACWSVATLEQRKVLLSCFVEGVQVDPEGGLLQLWLWRLPGAGGCPALPSVRGREEDGAVRTPQRDMHGRADSRGDGATCGSGGPFGTSLMPTTRTSWLVFARSSRLESRSSRAGQTSPFHGRRAG